jgi:hypothetical protein
MNWIPVFHLIPTGVPPSNQMMVMVAVVAFKIISITMVPGILRAEFKYITIV